MNLIQELNLESCILDLRESGESEKDIAAILSYKMKKKINPFQVSRFLTAYDRQQRRARTF